MPKNTDSKSYISEILFYISQVRNEFEWINQNKNEWDYANLDLPKTKYFQNIFDISAKISCNFCYHLQNTNCIFTNIANSHNVTQI